MWDNYHITSKTGPNGPALWSAITDLMALPPSLVESIKAIGGVSLSIHIDILQRFAPYLSKCFPSRREGSIRKVVGIPDKEGKTRVIAILDYWSQTCLKPVHSFLFRCLKAIPQDVTFDQGSYLEKVKAWGPVDRYHSVDLSQATDRFPIEVIYQVLK